MKLWHYLLCSLVIIVGIVCAIELYDIFSVSSQEIGLNDVKNVIVKKDFESIEKFNLGDMVLESEDGVIYTYSQASSPVEFDGTKEDYYLMINSQPVSDVTFEKGLVTGSFELSFTNTSGEVIVTSTLNIHIEFTARQTLIEVTCINYNDFADYVSAYVDIEGFVVEIMK